MSFPIALKDLPKKIGNLTRVERFSASQALNQVAFNSRKKVAANMEKTFDIKSPWVKKGLRVNTSSVKAPEIVAEVAHRYIGIAEHEEGTRRGQVKSNPFIIPTKAGKMWLEKAGIKRITKLDRILKKEVDGKKPFFRKYGSNFNKKGVRRTLRMKDLPKQKTVPIFTTITKNKALPLQLLFLVYDAPIKIPESPWFRKEIKKEYDMNFNKLFQAALKKNLKRELLRG